MSETRDILVKTRDGEYVIGDVPKDAKVTFGRLHPGGKEMHSQNDYTLRIYTGQNNQLAVFTHVHSFRDLSLTIKEKQVDTKLKDKAQRGPNGKFSEHDYEESYQWVEVDL